MNFAGSPDSTAAATCEERALARRQDAPNHPHKGFELITYLLAGEMEHLDSHGNHGIQRAFEDFRAGRFGEIKPIVAE
jgi:hypothetical protein